MPLIKANAAINNTVFFMMFVLDTINLDEGELFLLQEYSRCETSPRLAGTSVVIRPFPNRPATKGFYENRVRPGRAPSQVGPPPTCRVLE
jgi:hypothetical protein